MKRPLALVKSDQDFTEQPRLQVVRTDDLMRDRLTQIRVQADNQLIAEYAAAILKGDQLPPVVLFKDPENGSYRVGDGHHRIDAHALAAERDPQKHKPEVLAEIRVGGMDDAIRYAMGANQRHGKRLSQPDYENGIRILLDRNLLQAKRDTEVINEVINLIGCSPKLAQQMTKKYRADMIGKRDRLIWSMHREGSTQQAIADKLDLPRTTVTHIIERFDHLRSEQQMVKAAESRRLLPPPEPPEIKDPEPQPVVEAVRPTGQPSFDMAADIAAQPAMIKIDVRPLLPILARMEPTPETDDESGIVGGLPDVPTDPPAGDEVDDPEALKCLLTVNMQLDCLLASMKGLAALQTKVSDSALRPTVIRLAEASRYLQRLQNYLREG